MCGIIALVRANSGVNQEIVNAFTQMWWGTQLRGIDGSGLFQVDRDGSLDYAKSAYTPDYAQFDKKLSPMLRNVDIRAATVGHCRAATKRPAKADEKWLKKNAHPFQQKHITMVHNGYFSHVSQQHNDAHEVDSESFAAAVADKGFKEAINIAYGAYALVWWDSQQKVLNIARNADRPLHRMEHIYGHFYLSEPELGLWILKRNRLPAPMAIVEVPTQTLITYEKPFDLNFKSEVYERPVIVHSRRTKWVDRDCDDIYGCVSSHYPTMPSTIHHANSRILSEEEVIQSLGRFSWHTGGIVAKTRRSAPATARLGTDYADILALGDGTASAVGTETPPKDADEKTRYATNQKPNGYPLIKEYTKNGKIIRVFHEAHNFNIELGKRYTFFPQELHQHQTFTTVVGVDANPIAKDRVEYLGNTPIRAAVIRESSKAVSGVVSLISRNRQNGLVKYSVNLSGLKLTAAMNSEEAKGSPPKIVHDTPKLFLAHNREEEGISLEDLQVCYGCNKLFHKKSLKKYLRSGMVIDGRSEVITAHVCVDCMEDAKEDFEAFYLNRYKPNEEKGSKGAN